MNIARVISDPATSSSISDKNLPVPSKRPIIPEGERGDGDGSPESGLTFVVEDQYLREFSFYLPDAARVVERRNLWSYIIDVVSFGIRTKWIDVYDSNGNILMSTEGRLLKIMRGDWVKIIQDANDRARRRRRRGAK